MTMESLLLLLVGLALLAAGAVWGQRRLAARDVATAVGLEASGLRWQAGAMAAEITRRHRAGEALDADFFRIWRLSEPQVFPAVGASIALLPGDGIDRACYFHAQLGAARERLAMAAADGSFLPSPYRVLSSLVRAYNHIDPWVKPYLNTWVQPELDMSDANALLGELEEAGREPYALAYVWADACARFEPEE